jgi:hypothetical protein
MPLVEPVTSATLPSSIFAVPTAGWGRGMCMIYLLRQLDRVNPFIH